MKRSGHHAIINWLLLQQRGHGAFLNNCGAGTNPFLTAHRDSIVDREVRANAVRGRHNHLQFLIYNYEDRRPADVACSKFEEYHDRFVGKSAARFDVLIIRDPYNLIASKMRWHLGTRSQPTREEMSALPALWKAFAREYVGKTNFLVNNKVCVSFNCWFSSLEYRRELATRLQVTFTDAGVNEIARWGPAGWGDSFDGMEYDGRAQDTRVLSRWKVFARDPFYRELVSDPEIARLSEVIFGQIEGTDELRGGRC